MSKASKLTFVALCAGHFVNDAYSSIIYPLLPLLKDNLHLTTSQVFWLAPLYAISSSLMQPVYGFISDRYARRFFAVFGPAITAIFVSMIGLSPSYAVLIALLIGGGVGIGSFHPQAAAMAAAASTQRRRVGMALFSASGTIGFALGPIAIALIYEAFGLGKTYYIVALGLVMSAVLYKVCPPLDAPQKAAPGATRIKWQLLAALRTAWKPLLLLYLITVIRSGLQMTTNNYLPFLLKERGYEVTGTGGVITVFLLLGGVGGLAGGFMAERISGRAVTLYSGILAGPLLVSAFLTLGPLSIVLLGLGGFMLLSTLPVIVAMAQELVPGQTSTVSALMMGAAWGVGALAPPALDRVATTQGFDTVLIFASGSTLISAVLAYFLPREERKGANEVEVETATAAVAGD
ncbi:MAG TPA: MFS transporter [Blastocatellia bacterium]|nr:MFS transporter [Blastocatellia bacterium]